MLCLVLLRPHIPATNVAHLSSDFLSCTFSGRRSRSDILSWGADICNCKSSANQWCMIDCESIIAEIDLIYMEKSIGPRTEPRITQEQKQNNS